MEGDLIRLTVQDNGVGFLLSNTGGLGLDNFCRTLDLLHGGEAGLVAGDAPGGGALVSLRLPVGGPRG